MPASVPLVWDGRPFAEATPVRRERCCLAGIDEGTSTLFVELYDELAGAVIAAGEEVSVETQAGEAHHRGAGDAGALQQWLRKRPEARLFAAVGACRHVSPSSWAVGTRWSASWSKPGSRPSATAASRAR